MADTQNINAVTALQSIDANDSILVSDGNTSLAKIDYNKLAKSIIEQYTGSTLAGSGQSIQSAFNTLNSNLSSLYCRDYSYAAGTSYKDAVTDVLSKLGSTIARYWIIIKIGNSLLSLMIIKEGVQWSNGILTSYAATGTEVYFVMSRSDSSSNTVVYIRKLLTGD